MYPQTSFLIILMQNEVKFRPGVLSQRVKYTLSVLKNNKNSLIFTQAGVKLLDKGSSDINGLYAGCNSIVTNVS